MLRTATLAAPLLFALAACQADKPAETAPPPEPPTEDACGAGKLGQYLNALPTPDVMAAIAAVSGEKNIRTIRPGDAVTMDYRQDRLNVELGEDGRIKRLRCG